jgi:hypothetical protein
MIGKLNLRTSHSFLPSQNTYPIIPSPPLVLQRFHPPLPVLPFLRLSLPAGSVKRKISEQKTNQFQPLQK